MTTTTSHQGLQVSLIDPSWSHQKPVWLDPTGSRFQPSSSWFQVKLKTLEVDSLNQDSVMPPRYGKHGSLHANPWWVDPDVTFGDISSDQTCLQQTFVLSMWTAAGLSSLKVLGASFLILLVQVSSWWTGAPADSWILPEHLDPFPSIWGGQLRAGPVRAVKKKQFSWRQRESTSCSRPWSLTGS